METPDPTPAPVPVAAPAPAAATVSFAEFKKLDIRAARILSVENHPNADKLYVIKADIGSGERQIVAGLRPYYKAEELVGRTAIIIVNLEPAMLRGVQSQGMLLAASDGGRVLILRPDGDATPGAKVS